MINLHEFKEKVEILSDELNSADDCTYANEECADIVLFYLPEIIERLEKSERYYEMSQKATCMAIS